MADFPSFNLQPEDKKPSYAKENRKFFEQSEQDVVFQRGKAVKSKIMSSPMFNTAIKQYGIDAAKTIILQELIKMSEDEITEELVILSAKAEDDSDIKRSLRAAKFMAVQWLDDEKRGEEFLNKCQFIIDSIPTFKLSDKKTENKTESLKNKAKENIQKNNEENLINLQEFDIPDVPNKPQPPDNPPEPISSNVNNINKLENGEKILIITDIHGDYNRLRECLIKYDLVTFGQNTARWKANSKTKLVLVGDLFNKSPFSSWGGEVAYQTFQVIELIRRLAGEAENKIFLCLGNYDLKLCSGQVFKDFSYGFSGKSGGIKNQAQALPAMISFLEGTSYDSPDNLYSIWEREIKDNELFFKLKPDFQIGGKPDIRIKANEMYLPDISSIRGFLLNIYNELTLPKDKRPLSIAEFDKKTAAFLKSKPGEILEPLLDSKERSCFFEGILKGTKTISFLRKFISSSHKFQTERKENLSIFHVSLQNDVSQMFEKAKESNWAMPEFSKILKESKYLKMKKVDPDKLFNDLTNAGYKTLIDFLTHQPEDIFDELSAKNMLELFIPSISPNKVKFGFVKSFEKLQEALINDDKTGLSGFKIIDRKREKDFDDVEMKKLAELNNTAKKAYAEKILSDFFGNSAGFDVNVEDAKHLVCEKGRWRIVIDIDKTAALYQDENKAIHVPIKHIAHISYL